MSVQEVDLGGGASVCHFQGGGARLGGGALGWGGAWMGHTFWEQAQWGAELGSGCG